MARFLTVGMGARFPTSFEKGNRPWAHGKIHQIIEPWGGRLPRILVLDHDSRDAGRPFRSMLVETEVVIDDVDHYCPNSGGLL